ncbi:MAG: S8 family serine peptidase, partial [Candidatus Thermoplasmatota archaeon]
MDLKKKVVPGIVLIIVLSTFSLGFASADHAETTEISDNFSSPDPEEVLSDDLKERIDSKTSDEKIEVVIRLTPHEFDDREPSKTPLNEVDTGEVVDELKHHAESKQSEVIEHLHRNGGEVLNTFWIANAVLAEIEVGTMNEIVEHKEVRKIHENFEVETHDSTPSFGSDNLNRYLEKGPHSLKDLESEVDRSDPLPLKDHDSPSFSHMRSEPSGNLTWGLDRINAADVWEEGFDGSDVRVAVSDTGVDIDHPDLEGKMVNVEDDEYYTGGWIEFDSTGHVVENSTPRDTSYHGTHVSGSIAGGNASGTHIGVAPEVDLMHALVLPDGSGTFSQLLAGLEWKVEPHDRFGNPLEPIEEHRAHIASMSWGTKGYTEEIEEPIENMVDAGMVPVTSIGNYGEGIVGSPGAVYEAFGIGASNPDDEIADFSSGAIVEDGREDTPDEYVKPDFAAPGVDVISSVPGDDWVYANGTSMATPHVAGITALMLDAKSNLSVENIYYLLQVTADLFDEGESLPGEDKNTRYGHGIINGYRSVRAVLGNLTLRGAENISRYEATLKGEVLEVPNEEIEVFFRYRKEGEEQWSESEPMTITEPQIFESKIEGLEKASTYEYKAVGVKEDENETTLSLTFITHDNVEISTLTARNITEENAILRGEVTELYLENVSVLFRYRGRNSNQWNETDAVTITEPSSFEYKLHLEKLEEIFICEYRSVAVSNQTDFTGEVVKFPTGAVEPKWDEDKGAYLITNAGELQWIKNDLESDYIVQNDIDASWTRDWPGGEGFVPIGNESARFNGSFSGQDHIIKELYIESSKRFTGLFGFAGGNARINDVKLTRVWIDGGG